MFPKIRPSKAEKEKHMFLKRLQTARPRQPHPPPKKKKVKTGKMAQRQSKRPSGKRPALEGTVSEVHWKHVLEPMPQLLVYKLLVCFLFGQSTSRAIIRYLQKMGCLPFCGEEEKVPICSNSEGASRILVFCKNTGASPTSGSKGTPTPFFLEVLSWMVP